MNLLTVSSHFLIILSVLSTAVAEKQPNILVARRNVDAMSKIIRDGVMSLNDALMESAEYGSLEVVSYLLDNGADPNRQVKLHGRNETPLVRAIRSKNEEVARALLARGADPNLAGAMGMKPLYAACMFNLSADIIHDLLQAGADVRARGNPGPSPLHEAAVHDEDPEKIKLLLNAGIDPNIADSRKKTPLMYAAIAGNVQNLQTLLDHGANIDIISDSGYNALDFAIIGESEEAAEFLIARGAVPNQNFEEND